MFQNSNGNQTSYSLRFGSPPPDHAVFVIVQIYAERLFCNGVMTSLVTHSFLLKGFYFKKKNSISKSKRDNLKRSSTQSQI